MTSPSKDGYGLVEDLVRGFIAYVSLTPLVFCWGLLLIVVTAITLSNFETQTADAFAFVLAVFRKLSDWLPFADPLTSEDGVIEVSNAGLGDMIFGLYRLIAFPFVVGGMLLHLLRKPRPMRSLKSKLKRLALATLAVVGLLLVSLLFGSAQWSGGVFVWLAMFTIGPTIVFGVSALSLAVHQFVVTAGTSQTAPKAPA